MNTVQHSIQSNNVAIVFIDSNIEDYRFFISHSAQFAIVKVLDPEVDGVVQITDTLSQHSQVKHISIVCHGAPGLLKLGNSELSLDTLEHYGWDLKTWFSESVDSTLALYSCNSAVGDAGAIFIERMHQITGATIYASNQLVGNADLGGSWALDVQYGSTDLLPAFELEDLAAYAGVLATGTDGKYRYIDSNEPGGNVAFTDISTNGTSYDLIDDAEQGIDIPFSFNFYGTNSTQITIGNDGGIIFNTKSGNLSGNNGALPKSSLGGAGTVMGILPFWTDLDAGQVYTQTVGSGSNRRFIVQWNNVPHVDVGDAVTFQIVLHEGSNNIDFVYSDTSLSNSSYDYGAAATIGLNRNGSSALQYSFNTATLNGVSSIRFFAEPQIVNNTLTIQEEQVVTLTNANLLATDVDSSDPTKLLFTVSNVQHGQFLINNVVGTSFTQAQINAGNVKFVHDGGESAPSYTVTVSDNFNTAPAKNATIVFTSKNDIPVLSGLASSVTFGENALNSSPTTLYSGVTVSDVDSPDFEGGSLTVGYTAGSTTTDILSLASAGGISVVGRNISFNGEAIGLIDITSDGSGGKTLLITFTSNKATLTAVKALIENLTYQTTSDTPAATRTLSVTVKDGDGGTGTVISTTVNVTANNDSPFITIPAVQTVDEDAILTFGSANLISVGDPDAASNQVRVTLTATNGALTLKTLSGLTFTTGDGIDDPVIAMRGTVSAINTALNGMTFNPQLHFNGAASVKVFTEDLGNSGSGGSLSVEKTVDITVAAVNDGPVNTVPTARTVNEDTDLIFSVGGGNAISITDLDASEGDGTAEVTISVTQGLLKLATTSGLIFSVGTGSDDSIMTFTGSVADINAALNGLIYRGNLNFNGEDTLNITTSDRGNTGKGGIKTDIDSVTITVTPVNDAPVNTVPTNTQVVNEDTNLVFNGANRIMINDLDLVEGNGIAQVTLSVNNGTLSLSQITGLTFTNSDGTADKVITFKGTLASINDALNGLTYRGNQDFNGSDTLTIITNDLGNRGSGGAKTDTDTVNITINPVNDIPVITELAGSVTFNENESNLAFKVIDDVITVIDVDSANFEDGKLTVNYTSTGGAEDQLSVRNQGTGAGLIGFDGTTVTFGGTGIATVDAIQDGINGNGLTLTLDSTANAANIKALIQNLIYQNKSDTPLPNRTIAITLADGDGGTSAPISTVINVTAQNDPPVLKNNILTLSEGETVVLNSTNLSATDVDNLAPSLVFNVSNVQNGSFRVNGVTATSFTQAQVAAGQVRFVHDGGELAPTYQVSVSDGSANTTAQAANITFTNVNDAPAIAGFVSLVYFTGTEVNTTPELIDTSVTVSDIDSTNFDGGNLTISYSNGGGSEDQLSFNNQGTGSSEIGFDGNNVTFGSVTFGTVTAASNGSDGKQLIVSFNSSATPAAVKALLQNLTYSNKSDTPNESRTISMTLNDGDGGTSAVVTTKIEVASENDAPAITVPGDQTINEDQPLTFDANARLTILDPDAGDGLIQVKLSATQGMLTLSRTTGLTFSVGDGTDDVNMTLAGTLTDINNALDGALFKPTANYSGQASIQIDVNDQGNTGSGGPKADTDIIKINVDAVNDKPAVTSLDTQTILEDQVLSFTGTNKIAISDVDAGVGALTVTLSVINGVLSLSRTTGLTFSQGSADAVSLMTFSGSLVDINSALESLTYQGNSNYHGLDKLSITVNDQGNSGAGGNLEGTKAIDITVTAVNDAPINTVPAAQTLDEDTEIIFSDANSNSISIADSDVDQGTGSAEVTLSAANGTLTLGQVTGLTFSKGNGIAASLLTFRGAIANINAALNGLTYRSNLDFTGKDTLVITTNDLGNSGEGGVRSDNDAIDLTVNPINDAPVISGLPSTTIDQEFLYEFTPNTQDVDSKPLSFSIQNQPAWATFDPSTGRLSGTPQKDNVGTTTDIVISVSDGLISRSLPAFNVTVIAKAIDGSTLPDRIVGRAKDDVISGLDGDDILFGGSGNDLIYGGIGNDTIYGENGNDTLYGEDGNDILYGGNGDDVLYGGAGNDKIFGEEGQDKLYGGSENDMLVGGQDNDELFGETGDDQLMGDAGDDLLAGSLGNDQLTGGVGNDRLLGGKGNDKLLGGRGDDILDGGAGRNTLKGNGGKDVFVIDRKGFAIIQDFRNGTDRLAVAGSNARKGFAQLRFIGSGNTTIVKAQNRTVATLLGVNVSQIAGNDFANPS